MAGPMRDTFREVARVLSDVSTGSRSSAASRPARVTNAEIDRAILAFMREYVRSDAWEIIVPGEHTGGITHAGLFAVLASQGRDFFAATIQLYQAVQRALREEFLGEGALPSVVKMKATAAPALLDHVEMRLSKRGNADIVTTPLTPAYAARKRRLGRGSQPIGVASGELRRAYSRNATLRWKR